ncbi:YraN family protein [Heliorestis acidaminivorans]|uniref:UPF0102 protein F9B85_01615 n=1 Tax=Heliorestis acidaminivorans TaxID=553427 RepID=A0A6I0EXB2_9FIRM|nr:YraN family protein [Heliorestis acidaminivorans]KAB2954409.1 YraN family protein [Heliorestis acidaminivorans]
MNHKVLLGRWGEEQACLFLLEKGWILKKKNYRCSFGEIDLIFNDEKSIVFVEVRTRSSDRWGRAEETIDYKKKRRLLLVASNYLQQEQSVFQQIRFDLISINLNNNCPEDSKGFHIDHRKAIFTP